jgi:phosphoribosylaminoimidazole-succinocarboxamide synthase
MVEFKEASLIAKGKTKEIREASESLVYVCSMDNITAGDGAKNNVIAGKAEAANKTTCNVFELLERAGVKTHYIRLENKSTFLARKLDMIPMEFVVRRIATGSYIKRNPEISEGTVFQNPIFEIFEKDDLNHDPMLALDFVADTLYRYDSKKPEAEALIKEESISISRFADMKFNTIAEIAFQSVAIFRIIEEWWNNLGGTLYDFKIEFGVDVETGEILLGDVIDNDSWRLRFSGETKDKQSYRDGTKSLVDIAKDYAEVAALTDKFDTF